jgi:hypothetical protein
MQPMRGLLHMYCQVMPSPHPGPIYSINLRWVGTVSLTDMS